MKCRLCPQDLTADRVRLGHTGCVDCEIEYLREDVMAGTADWWIDPWQWEHQAMRQASEGVREALKANPLKELDWGQTTLNYGTNYPEPDWSANDR